MDEQQPTPRVTGSWQVFQALAESLAARLKRAAIARRSGNVVIRDPEAAGRYTERARFLLLMAGRFKHWPEQPEAAAVERASLGAWLMVYQRETEEELTALPGSPEPGGRW